MKQYVTHGTGSAQTLSEVQNTNVVVYDTKADAEADLSNLSEGQIVATKDSGDELAQPVDTIASGNMHAVTSNAVANSNAMPVDQVALNNLHSVTSNAVAQAFGAWQTVLTFDPNNYVECKQMYNDKILHFHFSGYTIQGLIIGTFIGTIPADYRPADTVRFLIDVDLYNAEGYQSGRIPLNVDYRTDGNLYLYPIIQNQATGQLSGSVRLFGDGYIILH